ncbi:cytochrome P450 [Catenuloplanes atrovinosus]|uniref:Cytochrome P450 n=1 Tax=Catenuloplanes atrovinosus TaxID=137266 RepID=A0AAE3YQF3_9ACTN|nr:cytochrome P450 [Catenuloplanes atrovinosus]MDR7277775.1 cytochrome P450 [Catenuloplanes atrovinosus]
MPYLDVLAPSFSFTSPETLAAQDAGWYADSPIGPVVLRYAEANDLLRDKRFDHGGEGYLLRNGVTGGPIHDWYVPMIVNHDGPDHRRLRGLVGRAFTPRMVESLRPFIRARAERLADEMTGADGVEFVDAFADRLPLAVMCELLGVPAADYDVFSRWSSDIGLVFGLANGGDTVARVERAVAGLDGYVDELMDRKAAAPGEDVISVLLAAMAEDGTASRDEVRNLLVTLVFAAHDNTRHQFSNCIVTFAEHPAQWTLLRDDPSLAGRAVEECMRWRPSAGNLFRRAAVDLTFHGVDMPAGTFVTAAVLTAQRDPRAYPGGRVFDITATREAPLLQFGAGPHYCLGAALARTELLEALPVLVSRFGPPELPPEPLDWRPPLGTQGPESLPIRFASAPA